MKSLIGKHNLNNAYRESSIFLKKLKKSEIQEGDIIITAEENTTNIYMVVLADKINYTDIDLNSITEDGFIFIQRLGAHASYLSPLDYNEDLTYLSDDKIYQIEYLFHSNYLTKDVLTKKDLLIVLNEVIDSINKNYPSIGKMIELV